MDVEGTLVRTTEVTVITGLTKYSEDDSSVLEVWSLQRSSDVEPV